jgi:anti-sigma regulatory factor (Ser/Thr protein kinase)
LRLEAGKDQVKTAREVVARQLQAWECHDLVESARVLTSELVANAMMHGHGPIDVEVGRNDGRVRVEVTDQGEGDPTPRGVDLDDPGGMGLVIVSTMASDWGIDRLPAGGKRVWFELDLRPV